MSELSPAEPVLLTPGPLTTAPATRAAMTRDWGSRDAAFIALTAELRARLVALANGEGTHVAVPIQGSGTYILEGAVGTLLRSSDKLLVLINGAYGERMLAIARRLGRKAEAIRWAEDEPVDAVAVGAALAADPAITHVALVHCETTSGILNPLGEVAAVVAEAGRALILDAMSSFGALPIDLTATPVEAVLASSNKCLEGAPGLAFALIDREALARAEGVSPSVTLDLHAQWRGFESNGQWRFTPPVQVVAACVEALRALEREGGPPARLRRYRENLETLAAGMARLGFDLFLRPELQAPIIATFRPPASDRVNRPFSFSALYDGLAQRGFLIYPGKLTQAESFRVGCIGAIDRGVMDAFVGAVGEVMAELNSSPARGAAA